MCSNSKFHSTVENAPSGDEIKIFPSFIICKVIRLKRPCLKYKEKYKEKEAHAKGQNAPAVTEQRCKSTSWVYSKEKDRLLNINVIGLVLVALLFM